MDRMSTYYTFTTSKSVQKRKSKKDIDRQIEQVAFNHPFLLFWSMFVCVPIFVPIFVLIAVAVCTCTIVLPLGLLFGWM